MVGSKVASVKEHRFVQTWSVLALLALIVGFTPSWFGRPFFENPPGNALTPLIISHGILFSAWMAFFGWQVLNIARQRYQKHRAMGWCALAFVPVALVSAIAVALENASRPPTGNEVVPPDVFLLLPILEVLNACVLILLGWAHRNTSHIHKRMMMFAMAAMVGTGSGRIAGFIGTFVIPVLFAAAIWVFDLIAARRINWWVVLGGVIAISTYVIPLSVGFSEPWRVLSNSIIELWSSPKH